MGRKLQDAYEYGTDRKFRNVGTKSSDAGRLPKKHNTSNPNKGIDLQTQHQQTRKSTYYVFYY